MKQLELIQSSFNNDSDYILEKLNCQVDFDIKTLSEETQQEIINLSKEYDLTIRSLNRFVKFANKLPTGYMDLKLHDLSYLLCQNEDYEKYESLDLFNMFCEISFSDMEETLESSYHEIVDQINHTSSFFISGYDIDKFINDQLDYVINNGFNSDFVQFEIDESGYKRSSCIKLHNEDFHNIMQDLFEQSEYDVDDIIEFMNEFKSDMHELQSLYQYLLSDYYYKEARSFYKYVIDFKNNQIEYFKEWFDNNKDWFDECLDEA